MRLPLTTQVGLLTISRAAGALLNSLVGFLIVRHLTQSDYGTFRQVYLLYATLLPIADLGLTESLYYFVTLSPGQHVALIRRVLLAIGVVQILIGGALLFQAGAIARFLNNPELASLMGLLTLFLGFSAVARCWETELIAANRTPLASLVIFGSEALKVVLMAAAVMIFASLVWLVWALVFAAAAKCVAFVVSLIVDSEAGTVERRALAPLRQQLHYGIALWIPGVIRLLSLQAHQYIVGHYSLPATFAIYSVACFQVPFLGMLSVSISEVFLVRATQCWSRGERQELYSLWQGTCRKALLFYIPVATALAALAHPVITLLFTRRYAASAPLFAMMVFTVVLDGVFQGPMLRACCAMQAYTAYNVVRGIVAVLLGAFATKVWGLWGAAASLLATTVLINLAQLISVARLLQVPYSAVLPWRDIGKVFVASALAAIAVWITSLHIESQPSAIAVGCALFGCIYGAMLLVTRLVRVNDCTSLLRRTTAAVREAMLMRARTAVTSSPGSYFRTPGSYL